MNHHCEKKKGLLHKLIQSSFILGFLSLAWYALRTGTKPSRQSYPCQQVAKVNSEIWFLTYIAPILTVITPNQIKPKKNSLATVFICITLVISGSYYITQNSNALLHSNETLPNLETTAVNLTVESTATLSDAIQGTLSTDKSNIYVVQGTQGGDGGIKKLIDLMGDNSLIFYYSQTSGENKGPTGKIAKDDTVIIKINSQWDQRGGTNTDLLKEVIQAIIDHPDGWIGEIIVADNGQDQYGSSGSGGSFAWFNSNAKDHSQSVQDVVNSFNSKYRVSTYLWDIITENRVKEYSSGDIKDGYIVNTVRDPDTGLMVSYPKFTTKYGTMVSFKLGIWNPTTRTYNSEKLKVINMPVLKTHNGYGVTGCVKHYMGVASDKLTNTLGARTHSTIIYGSMGTELTQTRYPILNILDCIWVNAEPLSGPTSFYTEATNVKTVVAGTDPVAIDYWASKNILLKYTSNKNDADVITMDPDDTSSGSFGLWLRLSMDKITQAGYQATVNPLEMAVFISQLSPTSTLTITAPDGGESWIPGAVYTITWTSSGSVGSYVKVELLKAGVLNRVISTSTANDGSQIWLIPTTQTSGSDYTMRVTSTSYTSISDSSDAYFTIGSGATSAITVTSPDGGESWIPGAVYTITWTSTGSTGSYVKIELLKGGVLNKVISWSTANDGGLSWLIPTTQTSGSDYRIRVTSTSYTSISDSSDAYFTIGS
jgi:hypothetical protein